MTWCAKHSVPLAKLSRAAFDAGLPHHRQEDAHALDSKVVANHQSHGLVSRFVDLCNGVLDSAIHLPKEECFRIVTDAAHRLACLPSDNVGATLLEAILDQAPIDWLCDVHPNVDWRLRGRQSALSRMFRDKAYPPSVTWLLMAAAAAFETADEALFAFSSISR